MITSVIVIDTTFVLSALSLLLICLLVVIGNGLVIIAVLQGRRVRRNPTNRFILSLAIADVMLGILVLPFSATSQMLNDEWQFGKLWCSIYLALDVLVCTASILNLCAISIDRYLAISHPISYPSIITTRRCQIIISVVWALAFFISFPPLIDMDSPSNAFTNDSANSNTSLNQTIEVSEICDLVRSPTYVIYSALGSFYIPCILLMFFYSRIFIVARRTQKSIKSGVINVATLNAEGAGGMRVHRGGGAHIKTPHPVRRLHGSKESVGGATLMKNSRSLSITPVRFNLPNQRNRASDTSVGSHESIEIVTLAVRPRDRTYTNGSLRNERDGAERSLDCYAASRYAKKRHSEPKRQANTHLGAIETNCERKRSPLIKKQHTPCRIRVGSSTSQTKNVHQPKKMNQGRYHREAKAAQTLSIVVGVFIICWFPFFFIYLGSAFGLHVGPPYFSVIFWLGYCNSAANPIIYAAFSREFRSAFKDIVCCGATHNAAAERRKEFYRTMRKQNALVVDEESS